MKKTLILALLGVSVAAHAASFTWKSGAVQFDGKTLLSGVTAHLVYLGTDTSVSSLYTISYEAPGTITPASSVQTSTPKTGLVGKGTISATYDDAQTVGDGVQVKTGNTFGMYFVYDDGTDKWFNFATATVAMTTDVTGAFEAKTFGFDFSTKTTIDAVGQTPSGWTKINIAAVPEPSMAALALAGLALLLKRRKA